MKDKMKQDFNIKADDCLVMEGCENDDRIVLGNFHGFLNHFCAFYEFSICHSTDNTKD